MKIAYRTHALLRMFQRQISVDDVRSTLTSGEIIEGYPADLPYPSNLILGWSGQRPLHVVAAFNSKDDEIIVVTVYEPDPAQWSADFRRRLV
jgi:hypothetical protein